MNKDALFLSIRSIQNTDTRHHYFHSNKYDSNTLLNYMIDPHSFDDFGNKKENFLLIHKPKIFDIKQGYVDFDSLKSTNPKSLVFTGIISFDEELSKQAIFSFHWEDVVNTMFQELLKTNDWDYNQWEMQANLHYNTNNKHIQFRIYQNEKTPDAEIVKQYYIDQPKLEYIRNRLFDFVEKKVEQFNQNKAPIISVGHVIRGQNILEKNKRIKQNQELIMDFVELIKLQKLETPEEIKKVSKIVDLYYSRSFISGWVKTQKQKFNLSDQEEENMEAIIKNNMIHEIFNYTQNNKHLTAFNFIQPKDPNDSAQKKQKFKNFDKINQNTTFEKLATYQPKVIKMVYKEPFSNFIDLILSTPQYNIPELESAISNYLHEIRPDITQPIEIKKEKKQLKEASSK